MVKVKITNQLDIFDSWDFLIPQKRQMLDTGWPGMKSIPLHVQREKRQIWTFTRSFMETDNYSSFAPTNSYEPFLAFKVFVA